MALMSDLIDHQFCPVSRATRLDEMLAFGTRMVSPDIGPLPASDFADLESQAVALANSTAQIMSRPQEGWSPPGFQIFNDLYTPGFRLDEDGYLQIHFPVPLQTPLSSTFLGSDWRFVALAWVAWQRFREKGVAAKKIIFSAFDVTGRRILAEAGEAQVSGWGEMALAGGRNLEVAGVVCRRCSLAGNCKALEAFNSILGDEPKMSGETREQRTMRLFYARAALQTQVETLEARRAVIDKELNKLTVDGVLKMGGRVNINVPHHHRTTWDFAKVFRILDSEGLWQDNFGAIKSTQLQARMNSLPPAVVHRLEGARLETVTEPSISEAASAARSAPNPTLLRGVAI